MKQKRQRWLGIGIIVLAIGLVFGLGFPLLMVGEHKQGKIALNEHVTLPLKIEPHTRVVLLYFGYVGCRTICVPSLSEIAQVFNTLSSDEKKSVVFYFVDISKEKVDSESFAYYFHKSFQGVHLSRDETLALMGQLHAYQSDALVSDGDVYHTGHLYLITRESPSDLFVLKSIYFTRPFDTQNIITDIQKELL